MADGDFDAEHTPRIRLDSPTEFVFSRAAMTLVVRSEVFYGLQERAETAERQRDLLRAELHDARGQLVTISDNRVLLREELDAARAAVKRMMHTVVTPLADEDG